MEKHNTKNIIPFKELVFENASLIEASAGTGKTYTVSALVLRAVLGIWLNEKQNSIPPMDITKIVLMTFTNAATADLKRKVFEKIHEVKLDFIKSLDDESYKPEDEISSFILEQYKGREADAITLLEQCEYKSSEVQVKTIHGFARSVLASNSLDTNLDQKYELHNDISKLKTTALINEIRKVVFDVKKYSLNELINFDCSKYSNLTKEEEKYKKNCDNVESNIKTFIKSIISLIEENGSKNFEVYNRNIINADCFINSGLSSELNRELNDNELSIQQKISKVVDWIVAELKNKDLWLNNITKSKLENIFEASTKQIIHYIYLLAFDNLEKIKDINKYITIDDLLIKLESALKNDKTGSLAKSIRNKFPLIIVDEFQDTDDVQLSIFKSIYINNIKANTKGGIRDNRIDHLTDNDKNTISNGDNKEDNTISCFIAVGDPKQSIYMFRGANIYGYQNIRNQINDEIGKLYTLDTNFRSSQKLIYATNLLFNVENNDLFSEQKINFEDVKANNMSSNQMVIYLSDDIDADLNKDSTALKSLFNDLPACHVNFITSPTPDLIEKNQKSKSKAWHQDVDSVTKSCVLKIVELLRRGYLISENGEYRKIRLSDIAILVRKINEYKTIYRALIEKGIPSVYLSNKEKIIDTDEYKAILYLMKAVCSPKSRSCIRQLVGSKFFNCDCAEFERILSDDVIEKVISLLSECNDIWHRIGFLKMLNHFLSEGVKLNNDVFINKRANSEIMLTNILHIAEVIQPICDKYGSNLSIENIIQESEDLLVSNDNVDESENVAESSGLTIRSSSTNNLLKIYTHHKSKGLEYNIVFIPYMIEITEKDEKINKGSKYIDYYAQSNDEIKKFYEISSFGTVYCNKNKNEQLKIAYDNYRTQAGFEELRLAYVAYTRAKYAMYLWTQNFKEVCETKNPLEKRLCDIEEYKNGEQYYKNDGNNVSFSKIFSFKNFTKLDVEQEWENVPICTEKDLGKEETDLEQYEVKECREKYKPRWKTTSFSSLTINSHNNYTPNKAVQIDEGLIDDETQNGGVESLTDVKKRSYSSLFPKGAEAGTFLHAIFEKISFKNDFIKNFDNLSEKEVLNTRLAKVVKQQIQLTKFDKNYGSAECREGEEYSSLYMLVNWVNDILQTPLVKGEEFSLSDIDDDCVLKEHEFFISLAQGDKLFSCNKLSDLFNEYNRQMLEDNRQAFFLPTDTVTKSDFDFENVQGFLKGYIDLFFMYKNKYYILDYKSNFLGEDYSDYNDDSLRQSIASSCYYLQYSLYTVAMNRFLKQRVGKDYRYLKNMGGAIYLYLRGVDSVTKTGGSYFHLLNEDFINRLDKVLNGEEDE